MKKYLYLFLACFFFAFAASAQQAPLFSQYMFNTFYINPAFAGVEGVTKFSVFHRSQWAGYKPTFDEAGALTTQLISMNSPVLQLNSGVGLFILRDQQANLNNTEAQVSYAFHLPLSGGKLVVGIRGGFFSQTIDFSKFRPVDPGDELLNLPKDPQIRPDMALGLYYRKEKFFVGASINHILKSEFNFGISNLNNALEEVAYFNVGYYWDRSAKLTITPTALIQTDFNALSFELGAVATINDLFWLGGSLRQSEAAILLAGINLLKDKSLKVGYSFDYVIKGQAAKQKTSHEVMLSYTLPVAVTNRKSIQRTPRFRQQ